MAELLFLEESITVPENGLKNKESDPRRSDSRCSAIKLDSEISRNIAEPPILNKGFAMSGFIKLPRSPLDDLLLLVFEKCNRLPENKKPDLYGSGLKRTAMQPTVVSSEHSKPTLLPQGICYVR